MIQAPRKVYASSRMMRPPMERMSLNSLPRHIVAPSTHPRAPRLLAMLLLLLLVVVVVLVVVEVAIL